MFQLIAVALLGIVAGFALGIFYSTWIEYKQHVQFVEPKESVISSAGTTIEVTQFVESISPTEKFKKAKSITDLF